MEFTGHWNDSFSFQLQLVQNVRQYNLLQTGQEQLVTQPRRSDEPCMTNGSLPERMEGQERMEGAEYQRIVKDQLGHAH